MSADDKGGRIAARRIIRPPVPQIGRPTARASRNGPPPVAPAEWAFDGNRIGRDNRHDWEVGGRRLVSGGVADVSHGLVVRPNRITISALSDVTRRIGK